MKSIGVLFVQVVLGPLLTLLLFWIFRGLGTFVSEVWASLLLTHLYVTAPLASCWVLVKMEPWLLKNDVRGIAIRNRDPLYLIAAVASLFTLAVLKYIYFTRPELIARELQRQGQM